MISEQMRYFILSRLFPFSFDRTIITENTSNTFHLFTRIDESALCFQQVFRNKQGFVSTTLQKCWFTFIYATQSSFIIIYHNFSFYLRILLKGNNISYLYFTVLNHKKVYFFSFYYFFNDEDCKKVLACK